MPHSLLRLVRVLNLRARQSVMSPDSAPGRSPLPAPSETAVCAPVQIQADSQGQRNTLAPPIESKSDLDSTSKPKFLPFVLPTGQGPSPRPSPPLPQVLPTESRSLQPAAFLDPGFCTWPKIEHQVASPIQVSDLNLDLNSKLHSGPTHSPKARPLPRPKTQASATQQ